ncbi:MAG: LysR family transcriptional regulator [Oscillospiraceae bacterium]|nr:LysR family transcriptional regulator [Oscillospiraceae bacterium]
MTYSEIECFLAICHYKTGSRAAEALYITQPSLSTRLKTLEKELGGQLFYRKKGSREMLLTDAGKEFYRLAVQYEALVHQMQQVCRKGPNKLRVSSLDSLDNFLLPQVYERFLQNFPQISLEIQDMDLEPASQSIHAGATDIAFTTGTNTDRALRQTRLFWEPMVIVCSNDLPLTEPVGPEQLAPENEIFVEWSSEFTRWHQQTLGIQPKLSISIMNHLQQFIDKGNCWSIVPISVALGLEQRCEIHRVISAFPLPRREVSIVTALHNQKNTAIEAFCQCLKETVAEYPQFEILI